VRFTAKSLNDQLPQRVRFYNRGLKHVARGPHVAHDAFGIFYLVYSPVFESARLASE